MRVRVAAVVAAVALAGAVSACNDDGAEVRNLDPSSSDGSGSGNGSGSGTGSDTGSETGSEAVTETASESS